jgi:hypothetical protein
MWVLDQGPHKHEPKRSEEDDAVASAKLGKPAIANSRQSVAKVMKRKRFLTLPWYFQYFN